jgi:hypothetical protein
MGIDLTLAEHYKIEAVCDRKIALFLGDRLKGATMCSRELLRFLSKAWTAGVDSGFLAPA